MSFPVEVRMPATASPAIERIPMSYDEWRALPDRPKAEWVDGVAVVYMTPPLFGHGTVVLSIARTVARDLPALLQSTESFLVLPRNRVRMPDLSVVTEAPADGFIRDVPVLVVEVLSPSTRGEDLIRKATEYAAAGIGQYWWADPDERSLGVHVLADGVWDVLGVLDDSRPALDVRVGEHGIVHLRHEEIFRA